MKTEAGTAVAKNTPTEDVKVALQKKQCEQYILRWKKGYCWVVIFIDEDLGMISVQSDYGDYGYRWGSPGMPFKEFLISINNDYLMGKFHMGQRMHFEKEETIKSIQRDIIKARRENGDIEASEARECWKELEYVEDIGDSQDAFFERFFNDCRGVMEKIYGNDYTSIPCHTVYPYQLQGFVKEIWPEFIKILKQETGK